MSRLTHNVFAASFAVMIHIVPLVSLADTPGASVRQTLKVHYDDLSLDRPADVKTLYRRITYAAQQVCGQRELTGSHLALTSWYRCYDAAVDQAVDAVASPALSAYYQSLPGHSGPPAPAIARR